MKTPYPENLRRLLLKTAAATAIAVSALTAQALEVTGSFTGFWDLPDQQNHGLIIAISRLANGEKTGVVFWAHFDDEGNPSWLFAQGGIEDDMIMADVYRFEGITFMQPVDENTDFGETIGTLDVQFESCVAGNAEFDTGDPLIGSGEFRIERLSNQPGNECSGGISDDMPPGDLPQHFDIDLVPTGVLPTATGNAEFDLTPGRGDFEVEIENVPAGDYELQVGGEARGIITVVGTGSGEIEFRSPVTPGKGLLDFDPRDQIIDVLLDGEVVLTALAPEQGDFVGNGPPPFDTPATGSLEIELELPNLGVYPDGTAEAEFEMDGNRVEFEVEVDDIPVGTYPLFIGGVNEGDIEVFETDDGGTAGEIEFRFPRNDGGPFFNFDPRGQTIEILEGAAVLFSGDFPDESTGDGDGDGKGKGNGPPDDPGPPDDDETSIEISVVLDNSGEFPDGSATAEYEESDEGTEFEIEVENVPTGTYPLFVGGVERGLIDVVGEDGDTEGEIKFEDPADEDDLLLDFDPRGQSVEIFDGDTLIFSADFPA